MVSVRQKIWNFFTGNNNTETNPNQIDPTQLTPLDPTAVEIAPLDLTNQDIESWNESTDYVESLKKLKEEELTRQWIDLTPFLWIPEPKPAVIYEWSKEEEDTSKQWLSAWESNLNLIKNIKSPLEVLDSLKEQVKELPDIFDEKTQVLPNPLNIVSSIWNSDIVKDLRWGAVDRSVYDEEEKEWDRVWNTFNEAFNKFTKWGLRINTSFNETLEQYSKYGIQWGVSPSIDPELRDLVWAIDSVSSKIDFSQEGKDFSESEWGYLNRIWWDLAIMNDGALMAQAETKAFESWLSIQDEFAKLAKSRTEYFNKNVFRDSLISDLTDEEAANLANSSASYVYYLQGKADDFNQYSKMKEERFYRDYYPDNYTEKINEKKKGIEAAQEVIWNLTKITPKSSKLLAEIEENLETPQSEINSQKENLWSAISSIANLRQSNLIFNENISASFKDSWIESTLPAQIKAGTDDFEQKFEWYTDTSLYNYMLWDITSDEAKTKTDYQYIKEILIPSDDTYVLNWQEYSRRDLEQIAEWEYSVNNRNIAARLVADHMTSKMRNLTDVDWSKIEILLDQWWWGIWMQWMSYVQSQIKELVNNKTKAWFLHKSYQAFVPLERAFWAVSQSAENVATAALRLPKQIFWEDTWIKTTLSVLGMSNELYYDKIGWDFNEWYDKLTNFVDEYWEAALDIPFLLNPKTFVTIPTKVAQFIRAWNAVKSITRWVEKYTWLWDKISNLGNIMTKQSEYIFGEAIHQRAKNYWWLKPLVKRSFLFNSGPKLDTAWQIEAASIASARYHSLWAAWKEFIENMIQDRVIANFIIWKTNSEYTDEDIFFDSAITVWVIPFVRLFTGITKWSVWFSSRYQQNKAVWDILKWLSWWAEEEKALFNSMLPVFWLKQGVDYRIDWDVPVPLNAYWMDLMADANDIFWTTMSVARKIYTESPNNFELAFVEWVLQTDMMKNILNNSQSVSRTWMSTRWYMDTLAREFQAVIDWWSPATVLAKNVRMFSDRMNFVKSFNSLAVVWQEGMQFKKATELDIKKWLNLNQDQLEAWITEDTLNILSEQQWIDLKSYFSKSEVKNKDWWVDVVYKYAGQDAFEWWHAKVSWTDIEELFNRLPTWTQKDIKVVEKVLSDLDIEIPC